MRRQTGGWWWQWVIGLCSIAPTAASAQAPDDEVRTPRADEERVVIVPNERISGKRLEALEHELLAEMNLLRGNPRQYARKLEALRPDYRGKLIMREGKPNILTKEGLAALEEAIVALSKAPPRLPRLAWSEGLARAADDHAVDLDKHDALGHEGSDGSHAEHRIARRGEWQSMVAENISFGPTEAEDIVIGLLVDDGVPDRGHREVLLTRELFFAGVGCGPHPSYGTVCVVDYATGFRSKTALEEQANPALEAVGNADDMDAAATDTPEGADSNELPNPLSSDMLPNDIEMADEAEPHDAHTMDLLDDANPKDVVDDRDPSEKFAMLDIQHGSGDERVKSLNDEQQAKEDPLEEDEGEQLPEGLAHDADEWRQRRPHDKPLSPRVPESETPVSARRDAPIVRGAFVIRYYHGPPRLAAQGPSRGPTPEHSRRPRPLRTERPERW